MQLCYEIQNCVLHISVNFHSWFIGRRKREKEMEKRASNDKIQNTEKPDDIAAANYQTTVSASKTTKSGGYHKKPATKQLVWCSFNVGVLSSFCHTVLFPL